MNTAKIRQKQLSQQNLSNLVNETRKFSNNLQDMFKIEANSIGRSEYHSRMSEREQEVIDERLRESAERERKRREEEDRQKVLADELYEMNRQKIVEEKLRQQIRESNHDLKELETKLRAAYVAKGLAAQLKEREALVLEEKLRIKNEQDEIERIRVENEEFLRSKWEEEEARKKKLRDYLKEQILTANLRNQQLYKEFLKEKRFLDEIAKRLQDENLESMKKRLQKMQKTKSDMDDFRDKKEIWKKEQKIKNDEENRKILEYCITRDLKKAEDEAMQRQLAVERDQKTEKMVAELHEIMEEANKREVLLQELYEIEKDEKDTQKLRDELEKKFRLRIETRIALDTQKANEKLRADMEADEERRFAEDQMKFMAERDKTEQLSDEKRRRKQMEYRKAIRELIDKRRIERVEQMAEAVKERDADLMAEQRREKLIEEERLRLLKEHANDLIGFLPNEILKELQKT